MYDLVIIGGGPAGATLARLVGEKMKVLVLDKRRLGIPYSNGFEKCCGGLLAPDAQEMLARLGLGIPKHVLVGPQLFTVRTMDFCSGLERYYPRDYVNVDREAFDRWLVSLLPRQVECRWGANYKSLLRTPDGLEVSFSWDGQMETVKTRLLVGADGAFSRVRACLGGKNYDTDLYISVQEWFKVETAQPYYSAIFDPAITDFYSWTIPKEGMLLVGAAIPSGSDIAGRFELLKQKLADRGYDLSQSIKKRGAHLLRPANLRQINTGLDKVALIGEAAGWISPSSAEGLSYAFKSALALAQALESGTSSAVPRYQALTRGLGLNILGKILKSPAMYWPPLRKIAMASGLMSIEIIR